VLQSEASSGAEKRKAAPARGGRPNREARLMEVERLMQMERLMKVEPAVPGGLNWLGAHTTKPDGDGGLYLDPRGSANEERLQLLGFTRAARTPAPRRTEIFAAIARNLTINESSAH
jgi:hypothetical protein